MALVWLLDLNIGGRTLHVSTLPVTWDGVLYEGTVDELTLSESLAIGRQPGAMEASVDLIPEIDVAELVSQAHTLTAGTATLRLWDTDEAEELAEVVMLDARCSAPEFGGTDEPISFMLSDEAFDDIASLIPSTHEINTDTWPDAPEDSIGKPYPLPLGTPGLTDGGDYLPAHNAYAVDSLLGNVYSISATAITGDNEITITGASGDLYTGMELTYDENGDSITGLTDEDTVYIREISANLYKLYSDQELVTQVLCTGTPGGTARFQVAQPYATTVLVAGAPVGAGNSVRLWFENDSGIYVSTAYSTTDTDDGLGQRVAIIDLSSLGGRNYYDAVRRTQTMWVAWPSSSLASTTRHTGAGKVTSIGHLLADLAYLSSQPMHWQSFLTLSDLLPQRVGHTVTEDQTPSELLYTLLRNLPIGLYSSPRGPAAVRLPTDPQTAGAFELVDGENCYRASMVGLVNEPDDALTKLTVYAALNGHTGEYADTAIRSVSPQSALPGVAQAAVSSDVYIRSSAIAQEPVAREMTESLDWTYSADAAQLVARWVSRQASVSPRTLTLDVPQDIARRLHLGHPVRFTSTDLSVSEAKGFVSQREMSSQELWRVECYFLHGVASDAVNAPSGASSTTPSYEPAP